MPAAIDIGTVRAMRALARPPVVALAPPAGFAVLDVDDWRFGHQGASGELTWWVGVVTSFEPVGLRPALQVRDPAAVDAAATLLDLDDAARREPDLLLDAGVGLDLLVVRGEGAPVRDAREADALAAAVRRFLDVTLPAAQAAFARREDFLPDPRPRALALPGAREAATHLADYPLLAAGALACLGRFAEARRAVTSDKALDARTRRGALARLEARAGETKPRPAPRRRR